MPLRISIQANLINASGWEYYSDNQGQIQVVGGRLRMD